MLRVLRVTGTNAVEQADVAAVEEPLEIRLHDRPFAVIMRTPGLIAISQQDFCSPKD